MGSTKQRHGLSRALKIFYGVGDFGFTAMTNVESYYFNYFLTDLAQFSLPVVSAITTITSLVDALLAWIYGAIMNSTKPGKYGRYRTWLIRTTWAVPLLFALQFVKIGDGILPVIIIVVATIANHILYNFPFIASISLMTVATNSPEERAQLASTRTIWNNASKVFFSLVSVPLASFFAGVIGEQNQYAGVAFCLAVVLVLGFFAHFKMFDGYEKIETESDVKKDVSAKMSAGDLLKSLVENPPLIFLMLANFADNLYIFATSGVAIYYFNYVANQPELLSLYIGISSLFAMAGAYAFRFISRRFECRKVFIVTLFAMAGALLVGYFLASNPWAVIAALCACQAGFGIAYSCAPVLYSDTITYVEWKTGKNATGWISGLQQLPLKGAIVARGLVISGCLAVAGWQQGMTAETVTTAVQQGICVAYMIIPAVFLAIGAVLLLFGFKLDKATVASYQAQIDARKAA